LHDVPERSNFRNRDPAVRSNAALSKRKDMVEAGGSFLNPDTHLNRANYFPDRV
jgi:hypothetical protein